jgi:glycerol dehydrogenase-like iron-containing ADH family enzyme
MKESLHFNEILSFLSNLSAKCSGVWTDKYCSTRITIGDNLIDSTVETAERESTGYYIKYTPIIEGLISQEMIKASDLNISRASYLISIGGTNEHNYIKEYCSSMPNRKKMICVPVPLSNDSFCTNRSSRLCDDVLVESRETTYPTEILIDLSILGKLEKYLNLVGLGEVIGFYYSLRDYSYTNNEQIDRSLINRLEENITDIVDHLHNYGNEWLKRLAQSLILKCLVMRVMENNRIGAGGDHLIAYALESLNSRNNREADTRLPHGELVFCGSIVMSALLPQWDYKIFSLERLIAFGRENGFLHDRTIGVLLGGLNAQLIQLAISSRPNRKTILMSLSEEDISKGLLLLRTALGVCDGYNRKRF